MYMAVPFDNVYRPSGPADMTLRIFEEAEFGGGDFFECLRTLQKIRPGNKDDWFNEWFGAAKSTETVARDAIRKGNIATARAAFLRAYTYYRTSHFYLSLEDERKKSVYLQGDACFREAAKLFDPEFRYVQIPFAGSRLDGIFFSVNKATNQKNAPLLIYLGGVNSQKEEHYFLGIQAALERGINVLAIDGPGQGSALIVRGLRCIPDFETPVGEFIDELSRKDIINTDNIAVIGRSFGGYLALRVAAFEKRIKACVAWGAYYDMTRNILSRSEVRLNAYFDLLGSKNYDELLEQSKIYTLKGILDKIKCPLMILHGEGDRMTEAWNATETFREATCEKHLHMFKVGEPGAGHCAHDAPTVAFPLIFDWIKNKIYHS